MSPGAQRCGLIAPRRHGSCCVAALLFSMLKQARPCQESRQQVPEKPSLSLSLSLYASATALLLQHASLVPPPLLLAPATALRLRGVSLVMSYSATFVALFNGTVAALVSLSAAASASALL